MTQVGATDRPCWDRLPGTKSGSCDNERAVELQYVQEARTHTLTHFDILCDDVRVVADGLHEEDL